MKSYLPFIKSLAKKAGKIIAADYHKPHNIEKKGPRDLVTDTDKKVEKFIIQQITKKFPDHAIYAEEGGKVGGDTAASTSSQKSRPASDYRWLIDPIDGTTNFIHKTQFCAVSIALEYKNNVIAGVVYNPILRELFAAEKGKGAYLNKKKIRVSQTNNLTDSLLATGFHPKYQDYNMKIFENFTKISQGIRRFGAAAIDICYVACGRFDGFWEFGLFPWDIAAGKIIVEEAGGHITNTDGSKLDYEKKAVLATNGKLHKKMLEQLN